MASTAHDDRKLKRSFTNLLTCRQILNIMVITGFMFNYMLRVNITIALVEMVYNDTNTTNDSTVNMRNTTEIRNTSTKYNWDKHATGQIIGSFFWGYILTELPGGRLSEIIGARKVLGFGMGLASVITLFMPMLCNTGYVVVSVFRALVGFCLGASFPALPPLGAKWIPPLERSKFMANLMASALGAAITMPICGYLIDSLGWESVFYVTGGIGLIWTFVWFALVYDSPAQHPRISDEERNEIEAKIREGQGYDGIKPKHIPWRSFLTSLPVWSIAITHTCSVYGYFTLVNQLPLFMKEVYNVSIQKNGFFSSFPYCAKYVMAILSSWAADRMRKTGKYSTTFIRKSFTLFAVLSPAACMAIEAIWHINENFSIAIFTLTLFFNGAVVGGYFSNPLDIAPNFSGTIMGLANTFSSLGGWVSATVVAEITSKNGTIEQWKYIFWMLVVVYMCGALTFTIIGTGDLQSWNSIQRQSSSIPDIKIIEMRPLNSTDNKS